MEIDVSGISSNRNKRTLLFGMVLAVVLVIFGLVGNPYTTMDREGYSRVLSWSDWRIFLVEQAYRVELNQLQRETDLLIEFLNLAPDPVRAQLTAERIERQYRSGSPVLDYQRSLLIAVADNVQGWSVGTVSFDQTGQSIDELVNALKLLDSDEPVNEPVPTPMPTSEFLSFLPIVLSLGGSMPASAYPAP